MPRRHVRFDSQLTAHVLVRPDSTTKKSATIANVSPKGLLLEHLQGELAEEASVWVEIVDAGTRGRVGLIGRVAWSEEDRAGVDIEAMFPHHRDRYGDLLEKLATD